MEEKDIYQIKYLIIPDFVFNNDRITFMAAKVYAFVHNYKAEYFFFHNERLAQVFSCSEDSITRAITLLKEEGYIQTHFDGRKRYVIDNYSIRKIAEADSADVPTLSEATDSADVRMLNEANLAIPNKNNINKNKQGKIFSKTIGNGKDLKLRPDFVANRKAHEDRRSKPKIPFGSSYTPRSAYPQKPQRKNIHAEDVV